MATNRPQQQQQQDQQKSKPEKRKPIFIKVDQLKPGTNGHTLTVKVVSQNVVLQKGRAASPHLRQTRIAECLVGDETGTILFTARNDQGQLIPYYLSFNYLSFFCCLWLAFAWLIYEFYLEEIHNLPIYLEHTYVMILTLEICSVLMIVCSNFPSLVV